MGQKLVFNPFTSTFDYVDDRAGLVVGPSSATDNALARYDGTTGKLIQNSSATLADDGTLITSGSINANSHVLSRIGTDTLSGTGAVYEDSSLFVLGAGSTVLEISGQVDPTTKFAYASLRFTLYNPASTGTAFTPFGDTYEFGGEGKLNDDGSVTNYDFYIFDNAASKYALRVDGTGQHATFAPNSPTSSIEGQLNVQPGVNTTKGFIIKGASSQSANLQEWQDSLAVALASVNSAGSFSAQGLSLAIVTKTANYTATANDYTILCNATTGAMTINLLAAASCTGKVYNIKKIDASVNTVTIDGNASETIDGATTKVIAVQYTNFTIQSNGTAWFIL